MTRITVILLVGLLLFFSSMAMADYRGDRGRYAGQHKKHHYNRHVGRHHKKHHRRHHRHRAYRYAGRHYYYGPLYGRYGYPGPDVVIIYQSRPGYYRYDY